MNPSRSRWLVVALGAWGAFAGDARAVDTSQWKCETCPFEKGLKASVDLGAGVVSDNAARYGNYTGLDRQGAYFIGGGSATYRSDSGYYSDLRAADLGLDTRSLSAGIGREGTYSLQFGYAEIPYRLTDTALTPFLGVGGSTLTLPPGFPAATTAAMPLAGALQRVDIGSKRSRYDLRGAWASGDEWTQGLSLRHDVRDGTMRSAGSFFSTTSQLVAPVDLVTDQLELSTTYSGRRLQATLAYQASMFRNGADSLTWQNPFTPAVAGATTGQLALAPDNQFHQILASVGYDIAPKTRASVDIAVGRMTQDAAFVPATLNGGLVVPVLPATSLHGRADTLNVSARFSTAPTDKLRLTATLTRDERNNDTPAAAWPAVATDMFVAATPRTNRPYSFTQDRLKLAGDYRGPFGSKLSFGADEDIRHRTFQEVDDTREATVWGRLTARLRDNVSATLKLAHAQRSNSGYHAVPWIDPAENPLLRKYNLANRVRDTLGLRTDVGIGETVGLGFTVDLANDDYERSTLGLLDGRSITLGADLGVAISDATQLHVFAQSERIRSRQAGSQLFAQPDWTGRTDDDFDLLGAGIRHVMLKGKLELSGDLTLARSRGRISVDTGATDPPFPTQTTARDSLRLAAKYKLKDTLWLIGSYGYERYDSQDWRLDGVMPATVANLLAFGEQAPRYHVHVLGIVLRWQLK